MPKARLSDVMVPADLRGTLAEVVDAARNRRTVLEKWGIGAHLSHGKGIAALLSGAPGTGKTLCAEAIAGELSRPLMSVSAADLLSKWVGESEQNIARVFSQAARAGAVLFLDEIDALLPARASASGPVARHDISMINTLLTAIERHDGLVLLATNLPDTLDPALARRLAYRLAFPLPDATVRARIWQRLLPATVPVESPLDFEALGRAHALTGGLIKNAVFKAAFRAARDARPLSQADLDRAAVDEQPARRAPRPRVSHPPAAH
jgi:SpoVK/Ycf46/Vps4 family AAA+-type ATPase